MPFTPTTLTTIPEELLLDILTHITTLPTLLALSSTSRLLHRLTLPHLYHTFPGRNSELFLRTISHSPFLASYTKSAVWRQERKTMPLIDVLEKRHIVTRLNELAVPHGTDLAAQFAKHGKNDDYWWFEVVMLFMPNVEEVSVRESWLWDDHHYWFKSLSPFFNPLCVSNLRSARLDGPMRIENIVPLLTIETLRSLEVTQVTVMRREGYRVFQWAVWPVDRVVPPRSSRLEHLCLKESYVAPETLVPVLQGIKALRSFTYEHALNELTDESVRINWSFSVAEVPCLSLHAHSLESVRIREDHIVDWSYSVPAILGHRSLEPGITDIKVPDYPHLHTLDLGTQWLRTSSTEDVRVRTAGRFVKDLPLELERLRFKLDNYEDGGKGTEMFLNDLARAIVLSRPNLKTVEIVDWDPMLGWYPSNLAVLQRIYTELGISLVSVAGDAQGIHGSEPLLIDEETESEWVLVTDLRS